MELETYIIIGCIQAVTLGAGVFAGVVLSMGLACLCL